MSDWTAETAGTGAYADVNGINLYYETRGEGRPLILLHGGLGSGEMFGPILPTLAAKHQVINVDLQAHGRTADIDLTTLLTRAGESVVGGVVDVEGLALFRHSVPLGDTELSGFDRAFRLVVDVADRLELELTGADEH